MIHATTAEQEIFQKFDTLVTLEEGSLAGGFGEAITAFATKNNYGSKTLKLLGISDAFVAQGSVAQLHNNNNLSKSKLKKMLLKFL